MLMGSYIRNGSHSNNYNGSYSSEGSHSPKGIIQS